MRKHILAHSIRGKWPNKKSILLMYPIGAGGEFIGHTVHPLIEHNPDINRYEHLSRMNQFLIIDGKPLSDFVEFMGLQSHYFNRVIGWCSRCDTILSMMQYTYSNKFDVRQSLTFKSLKKMKRARGIDPLPLAPDSPIIVVHNHFNIHKFFPSITKAYCLISNSYALRLVWSLCCIFKLDSLDRDGDVTWFNEASLIDDAQYLQLERRDKPLYEKYKTTIEDDIEFITPAELDFIQDGLATKYKKYTEINIEMIKKLPLKENLMADYTGRFSWLERVEYI